MKLDSEHGQPKLEQNWVMSDGELALPTGTGYVKFMI